MSKVLRNKDKYLLTEQGDRSPARKHKGKFPDIERALSNWAKNHQKNNLPMSDALIKEQLRFFSLSVGGDSHAKQYSSSWLEKFKQKNNLMGAKSRKNSVADDSEVGSNPGSGAHTPNISPTSPGKEPTPPGMDMPKIDEEAVKSESPDLNQADFFSHRPYHSLSNASLASAFNDNGSSFSPGPHSPATSPFFSPDSASPFIPQSSHPGSRVPSASAPNSAYPPQRPRSQTLPMLGIEPGSYVSPPSSEPLTPKYSGSTALDDLSGTVMHSVEEMHELHGLPINMHHPPPVISSSLPMAHHQHSSPLTPSSAISSQVGMSPSLEDTRRALEIVMTFFQGQPNGSLEPQEYMMMGKLMEKLQLQHRPHQQLPVSAGGSMPGGMHRIHNAEFVGYIGKE